MENKIPDSACDYTFIANNQLTNQPTDRKKMPTLHTRENNKKKAKSKHHLPSASLDPKKNCSKPKTDNQEKLNQKICNLRNIKNYRKSSSFVIFFWGGLSLVPASNQTKQEKTISLFSKTFLKRMSMAKDSVFFRFWKDIISIQPKKNRLKLDFFILFFFLVFGI